MRIVRHFTGVEDAARGAVVALGNFDGLHRGHASVLAEARRIARERNAPLGVVTFEPHPRDFFGRTTVPFRLTPFRVKARLLAGAGVDVMFNLRFGAALAAMEAEDFVTRVLVAGFAVRQVVVGPGFVFGKGRVGNDALLRRLAAREGFGFTEIAAVHQGEQRCSSTEIRASIRRGRVDEAAAMLGRPWEIEGRVHHGAGQGQGLGFPTANIALDHVLHPDAGIYAVRVGVAARARDAWRDGADWHDGAAYIGTRPTFAGRGLALEIFLLDYDDDLYARRLRIAFIERVRGDRAFAGPESLKAQMARDCERVRRILADARARDAGAGASGPIPSPPISNPSSNPPAA